MGYDFNIIIDDLFVRVHDFIYFIIFLGMLPKPEFLLLLSFSDIFAKVLWFELVSNNEGDQVIL